MESACATLCGIAGAAFTTEQRNADYFTQPIAETSAATAVRFGA